MNKQDLLYLGCSLNRIAARYNCNPFQVNPINVLQEFFDRAGPAEQVKSFERFCIPAMTDQYKWINGSPANGLYYGEQLEMLLESAYLLCKNPRKYPVKSLNTPENRDELPLLLTWAEYDRPSLFLKDFFNEISLPQWKRQVAVFTSASISNDSVADELTGPEIFKFITTMPRLFYAAHRFLL